MVGSLIWHWLSTSNTTLRLGGVVRNRKRTRKGEHRNGIVIVGPAAGSTVRQLLSKIGRSRRLRESHPDLIRAAKNALRIRFLWIPDVPKRKAGEVKTHFLLTKSRLNPADLDTIVEAHGPAF